MFYIISALAFCIAALVNLSAGGSLVMTGMFICIGMMFSNIGIMVSKQKKHK